MDWITPVRPPPDQVSQYLKIVALLLLLLLFGDRKLSETVIHATT